MQFKLLNFHKFVGNFASSLVGTFIPLMIYKQTGSIRLACLFIVGQSLVRILSNHLFKKLFNKYPQLTLLIRIVPMVIYNISLILLEKFMIVGIVIVAISYGASLSLKNNALGVLLNYTSKNNSQKKLTITRCIEALSSMVAAVSGGLFIDWNQTALIIFSLALYIVSVIPLVVYFIGNKGQKGFNVDYTSNLALQFDQEPELKAKRKSLVKEFIVQFFIFYAVFCVIDNFTSMYSLHLFISAPTFAQAGYITAVFQLANLCAVLCVEKLAKKIDLNNLNFVFGIVCGIPVIVIPFITNYLCIYLLIFVYGFAYAICSYFMMNSLMEKCKIISATNKALVARQDGIMVGYMLNPLIVIMCGQIVPIFFVMVGAMVFYSVYTLIVERHLRAKLVNYIENNEIE